MAVRLLLTVVGVLLMIAPPFSILGLDLVYRLQNTIIAAIELPCLVVGFVLLYLGLREQESKERES